MTFQIFSYLIILQQHWVTVHCNFFPFLIMTWDADSVSLFCFIILETVTQLPSTLPSPTCQPPLHEAILFENP